MVALNLSANRGRFSKGLRNFTVAVIKKRGIIEPNDPANSTKAANDFMINRENPRITEFNPNADYSINVPGLSDRVNYGLSDATRRVAEKGSVSKREAMELVDLRTGKSVFEEIGYFDSVGGEKFWQFIEQHPNDRLAFVHSHNTDGFLSSTDMQTIVTNEQIQMMISTSNDGLKRIAYGNIKDNRLLSDIYQSDLTSIGKTIRAEGLSSADYHFRSQARIVENAIRDYANLGFWEVDGRV